MNTRGRERENQPGRLADGLNIGHEFEVQHAAHSIDSQLRDSPSSPLSITVPSRIDSIYRSGTQSRREPEYLPITQQQQKGRPPSPSLYSQAAFSGVGSALMSSVQSTGLRPVRSSAGMQNSKSASACFNSTCVPTARSTSQNTGLCNYLKQLPPTLRRAVCSSGGVQHSPKRTSLTPHDGRLAALMVHPGASRSVP